MKKFLLTLTLSTALFNGLCPSASAKGYIPSEGVIYVESTNGFDTAKIGAVESGAKDQNVKMVANKKYKTDLSKYKDLKKGESSLINVMWMVEVGDASIYKAAQNGGIKEVLYVDRKCDQINAAGYFFYRKMTTIVYGK